MSQNELGEVKIRVDREFYERIQDCAERFRVDGGVSGVFRRAIRRHLRILEERGCVAVNGYAEPATRSGSTVMTVFLTIEMVERLHCMERQQILGIVWDFMNQADLCRTVADLDPEVARENATIRDQERNLQRMMSRVMTELVEAEA